ncbi:glycoside hydrolase family 2 protein [Bacillus rubiinfantis]|uniref:glycoside hydrolase family 2 protein n=1 Tax=Bacillus rubiinfantis TaxID=1499680 RepID=UPI000AAB546E|nr:sugar-binding domain-containing protein [Bacillus rubiinfantis]
MSNTIPRNEYPRPQLVRDKWINLNGEWDFAFDDENKGISEKWYQHSTLLIKKINVPFAYQTKLSGIHDTSFHDIVWYSRHFSVPKDWKDQRILLHFGAVDYRAWIYINGQFAGFHEGGHVPFSLDITEQLTWDVEKVVVRVEDPSTDETIPRGKQFWVEKSASIWYTRTTGIWQTVWLEPVNSTRISKVRFSPDIDRGDVIVEVGSEGDYTNKQVEIIINFQGKQIVKDTFALIEPYLKRAINLYNRKIFRTAFHHDGWNWSPENPNLFDITITLKDDNQLVLDKIDSYFGMRKVHAENGMVYLNNKPYYQKLVLDQGYWPEGLLTAPTDEDLKEDIELALAMGFNGCRKHQKVEDPRFLYWADRLGFLVWGECASFISYSEDAASRLTKEWIEIIERDYNHPSIIAWVPVNESWGVPFIKGNKQQQHHSLAMYHLIQSLDPTRLVISNDGWELTRTDICAIHNYNHGSKHETEKYLAFIESLATKENLLNSKPSGRGIYADGFEHQGEPIILTEFGGIGFKVGEDNGWGYTSVKDDVAFIEDYRRVMEAVFASKALHGFCYTQLTDVEQEINGLLSYSREPKCELAKIREINDMWHYPIVKD